MLTRQKIMMMQIIIVVAAILYADQILIEEIAKYDEETSSFSIDTVYEVKPGESLIIPAGTHLYFGSMAGIDVKGGLVVTGTYDRQVILASKTSVTEHGATHDWRGIQLHPGSTANIRNAVISNAFFGIRSCCDNVNLSNVVFHTNGIHFQIENRKIHVENHEPVYYEKTIELSATPLSEQQPVQQVQANPAAPQKAGIPARTYLTGAISLVCLIAGPIYISKWATSVEEYNNYMPGNQEFDVATATQRLERFDKMAKSVTVNRWLGAGLTTLGLAGGTYTVVYTLKF